MNKNPQVPRRNSGINNYSEEMHTSIQRRVLFAGDVKYWIERHVLKRLPSNMAKENRHLFRKIFRKSIQLINDLWESLRLGKIVPYFADSQKLAIHSNQTLSQHPRYLSYWSDTKRNALVGIHLGVDFIKKDGKYHLLEFNTSAGLSEEMRRTLNCEVTPIITKYSEFAQEKGFENIKFYRFIWLPYFKEEVISHNKINDIQIDLIETLQGGTRASLPTPLEKNTLYVFFVSSGPLATLITDKHSSSLWCDKYKAVQNYPDSKLELVPTYTELKIPEISNPPHFPNLVVKLSGLNAKKGVMMLKALDEASAMKAMDIKSSNEISKHFKLPWKYRFQHVLFNNMKRIYQPYIVSDLDEKGCINMRRIHCFFSPDQDFQLFTFGVRSPIPVGGELEEGIVPFNGMYSPWVPLGGSYTNCRDEEQLIGDDIVAELGLMIRAVINDKFETSPSSTRVTTN